MIDEIKLHKDKERGARAETILRDDLLQEAFKTLEADYIKAWASTDHAQAEARENFWRAVQILGDVRRHLLNVAKNGQLAQRQLSDLADKFRPRAA